MLATALIPPIGYDKASQIARHALEKDPTLKAAALELGFVGEAKFDRIVDPQKMTTPYVASASADLVHAVGSTRSDA
jgi:fumarate hydratase class II